MSFVVRLLIRENTLSVTICITVIYGYILSEFAKQIDKIFLYIFFSLIS